MNVSIRHFLAPLFGTALCALPVEAQWYFDEAAPQDAFGSANAMGDFDGDGIRDLAVGIPGEDVAGANDAGAVRVYYSVPGQGPDGATRQYLNEASLGFSPRAYEKFGFSLAAGNFDGDAYDDLAIGAYGEDIGSRDQAGAVYVVYGGPGGLDYSRRQLWHQDSPSIAGGTESGDWFGYALEAADFDLDGFDDLGVGVPHEDIGAIADAGAAHVIYGASSGLVSIASSIWYQDVYGIQDHSEAGDYFGFSLTSGDFDNNGVPDLAIGVPGEDLVSSSGGSGAQNAGMACVLRSLVSTGVTGYDYDLYPSSLSGNLGSLAFANFGFSMTGIELDDGHGEWLAIGAPYQRVGSVASAGRVHMMQHRVILSFQFWVRTEWDQDQPNVWEDAESYDEFGYSLAAGSEDGTLREDLYVGVPGEDYGGNSNPGIVGLLKFKISGGMPKFNGGGAFYQNTFFPPWSAFERNDRFGRSIAVGDLTGEGFDDLAVGMPGKEIGNYEAAGAVSVLGKNAWGSLSPTLLHEIYWTFGGGGGGGFGF